MDRSGYSSHPEYLALIAAVRADLTNETVRLVLADWVQERGHESEALAIREHRSFALDLLPALSRDLTGLADSLADVVVAIVEGALPPFAVVSRILTEVKISALACQSEVEHRSHSYGSAIYDE
ncbi:unnamed protein product [Gemmata massiliana]|uniref:Uncharacterized protein n=1 Tax=Gemmata massiliana TaxID=1210884 RepID=A0A6P2D896_9BACT|nr:TIGR02996 domain-containing protein [Gemmata massiliana]VTR97077.1 unnamed protein product [Gemmata massiliana]